MLHCATCSRGRSVATAAGAAVLPSKLEIQCARDAAELLYTTFSAYECSATRCFARYLHISDTDIAATLALPTLVSLQEGLLFAHKDWHYEPGPSAFLLRWRDDSTSASLKSQTLSSAAAAAVVAAAGASTAAVGMLDCFASVGSLSPGPPAFVCVLEALASGGLATRDDAIVGSISADDVRRCAIVPGDLVACSYSSVAWVPKPAAAEATGTAAAAAGSRSAGGAAAAEVDHDSSESEEEDGASAAASAAGTAPAPTTAPVLIGLQVVCKEANPRRVHADLLSRVLFQVQQASPATAISIATMAAAVAKTV